MARADRAACSVEDLWAGYESGGAARAVRGVSFEVEQGAFFVLLGASGCGKTTTLRCISGLHRPSRGRITIAGREVYSGEAGRHVAPDRRGLGMVFQSYALWPHLSALDNVAFPIRWGHSRVGKRAALAAGMEALNAVGVGDLAKSYPWMMSGGQQQRVALARALVAKPKLLLLDEPLSNLDASLRSSMRSALQETIYNHGVSVVYVTHDQAEALSLATVIAVMHDGQIIEWGTPANLYERPTHAVTAAATGRANILRGSGVTGSGDGRFLVTTGGGPLECEGEPASAATGEAGVFFRPEAAVVEPWPGEGAGDGRTVAGVLSTAAYLGGHVEYDIDVGGERIAVEGTGGEGVAPGERVAVRVQRQRVRLVVQ